MCSSTTIGRLVSLAAAAALLLAGTAATDAQRRNRDNSTQGLPVATTLLVRTPEAYYDKLVTIRPASIECCPRRCSSSISAKRQARPR